MPFCRNCGLSVTESATFCATCGEPVDVPRRDAGQPAETPPPATPPMSTTVDAPQLETSQDDATKPAELPPQPLAQVPQATPPAGGAQAQKPPAWATVLGVVIILAVMWGLGSLILHAMGCNANGTIATPGDWTTATTLNSSDPRDPNGILTSQPFTTTNKVRVIFSIPRGDSIDSMLGMIVPASEANNVAYMDGEVVSVSKTFDTDMVSGLNGTYVLQVATPGLKEWSMEIQTSP